MPMSPALKHFLSCLTVAERIPLPVSEEWKEHVARISVPGRIAEVTREHYYHWLEVLPPHFMGGGFFAFAEGPEPFRLFWCDADDHYWVRQLTWKETVDFCRLAHIPLPD